MLRSRGQYLWPNRVKASLQTCKPLARGYGDVLVLCSPRRPANSLVFLKHLPPSTYLEWSSFSSVSPCPHPTPQDSPSQYQASWQTSNFLNVKRNIGERERFFLLITGPFQLQRSLFMLTRCLWDNPLRGGASCQGNQPGDRRFELSAPPPRRLVPPCGA